MDKLSFSVNSYDYEGDIVESGIFIHKGIFSMKVANDYNGFIGFINTLSGMKEEIKENWEQFGN